MINKNILIILVLIINIVGAINTVGATEITSEDVVYIGSDEFNITSGADGFSIPLGLPQEVKQRIINRTLIGMTEEQKMKVLKSRTLSKLERFEQQISNKNLFNLSEKSLLEKINESGIQNNIGQYILDQYLAGVPDEFKQQYLENNMQVQSADPGVMSSSFTISGNVSILWEKHTSNNYTYAYAVNDIDGDNKPDILVNSLSISGTTQTVSITALRGYDSYQLWTKSVSGTSVSIYGYTIGDLSEDGKPDILVRSSTSSGTTQTASITALRGYDGNQLWTKSVSGTSAWIYEYSYSDLSGDGKPDIIIESSSSSGTTVTASIFGLRGYDGYQLWTRSVSGDSGNTYLSFSNYLDFTGDNIADVIINARSRTGTTETYSITGLRSYDGYQLWTKSVSGDAGYNDLYASYQDLTGDNLRDVIIEAQSKSGTVYTASVTGFQGNNGAQLWSKSISGTSVWIYSYTAGDLSGDGKTDVLIGMYIYNGGSPVTATTYALRGYDGYQLFSKSVSGTSVSINSYSAGDLSGDGISDAIVGMSVYNGGSSVTATAYALRGYDGYQLWSRSVSGTSVSIWGNYAGDLSGDSVLVGMYVYNGGSSVTATAYALRGYDGYQLWSKSVSGTSVSIYGYTIGDLSGDSKSDVIIQSNSYSGTTQTASLTALRGYDGYQLWTRSVSADTGYADMWIANYRDFTGDGLSDVIVQARSRSGATETESITGLRGYDGYQLWSKSVNGDAGYYYFANTSIYVSLNQDFTGDGILDVKIETGSRSGTTETESITGLRSYDGYQLWSRSVSGDYGYTYLYASTYYDLTGDNLPDVIIQAQSKSGTTQTSSVTGLQGNNGVQLWSRSVSGDYGYTYIYASAYTDFSGDSKPDVIISAQSKSGTTQTASVSALRGYDGYQLWSRSWSGENIGWQGTLLDWDNNGQYDVLLENISLTYVSPNWKYESTIEVFKLNDGVTWWTASADSIMQFSGWNPDLNGDNKTDVLISTPDSVYALTVSSPTIPVILITPSSGPVGTVVSIGGSGFISGATVKFGNVTATSSVVTSAIISAIVPTLSAGTYDVKVINPDGSFGVLPNAFTVTGAPALVAAIAPSSRVAQIGSSVTLLVAVINYGTDYAQDVQITQHTSLPISFTFKTWDGITNFGQVNAKATIEPNNGVAFFVLDITPTSSFPASSMTFDIQTTNGTIVSAPITLVNTFTLSATSSPSADIVMISTVTDISASQNIVGAFAIATSNVGNAAATNVSLVVDPGTMSLVVQGKQTNPSTGAIIGDAQNITIGIGEQPTFAVFYTPTGPIANDPNNNRIMIRLVDGSGNILGSQSVSIHT